MESRSICRVSLFDRWLILKLEDSHREGLWWNIYNLDQSASSFAVTEQQSLKCFLNYMYRIFHPYGGKHHKVLPLSKSLIPQKLKIPKTSLFYSQKLSAKSFFSYLINSHHLLVKLVTTTKERNEVILNSGNNNAYYFVLHSLSQLRNTLAADFFGSSFLKHLA